MDIPPFNDVNKTTKTAISANVKVVGAATLIGVPIQIVEIRLDTPDKYHKKVDMFVFKRTDGIEYGFYNSILRRWNLQPGDTITLQLVTGSNGSKHYEPTNINGNQQTVNPKKETQGLDRKIVIKLASESDNAYIFMSKIAPLLAGTKYASLSNADRIDTLNRIYEKYKPAPQANSDNQVIK